MTCLNLQRIENKEDLEMLIPKDMVLIEDFGEMCLVEKNEASLHFMKREKESLIQVSADIYDSRTKIKDNKLIGGGLYIRTINQDHRDYQKYNQLLEAAGQ